MSVYAVSHSSKRAFVFSGCSLELVERICTLHNARRPGGAFPPLYSRAMETADRYRSEVQAIRYANRVANEFRRTMFMCTDLVAIHLGDLHETEGIEYYKIAGCDKVTCNKAEEGQKDFRVGPKWQFIGMCLCLYTGKWKLGELTDIGPQLDTHRNTKNGRRGYRTYKRPQRFDW